MIQLGFMLVGSEGSTVPKGTGSPRLEEMDGGESLKSLIRARFRRVHWSFLLCSNWERLLSSDRPTTVPPYVLMNGNFEKEAVEENNLFV